MFLYEFFLKYLKMQLEVKRYNVVIRGKVQDIGFRDLVERLASFLGFKGYVFNDLDGSVKLVIEGLPQALDDFFDDIKEKTQNIGAEIESIEKREITRDFDLPPRFIKIPTTELEEIGRKLDIGINELRNIRSGLGKILETQEKMLNVLEKIEKKI